MMTKDKAEKWHLKEKEWRDNCFPEDWPIITKSGDAEAKFDLEQAECVCLGENNETKPYKCPVCGGRMVVPHGFYSCHNVDTVTAPTPETCKTCNGSGVIWRENSQLNRL